MSENNYDEMFIAEDVDTSSTMDSSDGILLYNKYANLSFALDNDQIEPDPSNDKSLYYIIVGIIVAIILLAVLIWRKK